MTRDDRTTAFRHAAQEALRWSKHAEGGSAQCIARFRDQVRQIVFGETA